MSFFISAILAASTIDLYYIPLGHQLVLESGEEVKYFTFDEYKMLLELDASLRVTSIQADVCSDAAGEYMHAIAERDKVIEIMENTSDIHIERADRMEARWKQAQAKLDDPDPLPYLLATIGSVIGLVGAGLWIGTLAK